MLNFIKDLLTRNSTNPAPLPTQVVAASAPVVENSFKLMGRIIDSKTFNELVLNKTLMPLIWQFTGGLLAGATIMVLGPVVERLGTEMGQKLVHSKWLRRFFKATPPVAIGVQTEPVQQTFSNTVLPTLNPWSDQSIFKVAVATLRDKVATPPIATPPVATPPIATPPIANVVSSVAETAINSSEAHGFMAYLPTFNTVLITACVGVGIGMVFYYLIGGIVISIFENEDLLQKQASALRVSELASATPEIPLKSSAEVQKLIDPQVADTIQKVAETLSDKIS